MYSKMPFGLINARATFQRAMDISFSEERDKFVVIYLVDKLHFLKMMKNTFNIYKEYSKNA